MYAFELVFDRPIDSRMIQDAVAGVLGHADEMSVLMEMVDGGDFPCTVRVVTPFSDSAPSLPQFIAIAKALQRIFLTDDIAVGELWDDGYSLISPDGFTAVVRAEEDALNEGWITLNSVDCDLYRSVRERLSHAAAD